MSNEINPDARVDMGAEMVARPELEELWFADGSVNHAAVERLRKRLSVKVKDLPAPAAAPSRSTEKAQEQHKSAGDAGAAPIEAGPTLIQARMRPNWRPEGWTPWSDCSAESAADYERTPVLNDWAYEVRRLYVILPQATAPEVPQEAVAAQPEASAGPRDSIEVARLWECFRISDGGQRAIEYLVDRKMVAHLSTVHGALFLAFRAGLCVPPPVAAVREEVASRVVPLEALSRWRKWCLGYEWPKGQDWDSHDVYLAIADEIRTKYEENISVPGKSLSLSDAIFGSDGLRAKALAAPQARSLVPLTEDDHQRLFRIASDWKTIGEKDPWFWFAWGIELGERAHGILAADSMEAK